MDLVTHPTLSPFKLSTSSGWTPVSHWTSCNQWNHEQIPAPRWRLQRFSDCLQRPLQDGQGTASVCRPCLKLSHWGSVTGQVSSEINGGNRVFVLWWFQYWAAVLSKWGNLWQRAASLMKTAPGLWLRHRLAQVWLVTEPRCFALRVVFSLIQCCFAAIRHLKFASNEL